MNQIITMADDDDIDIYGDLTNFGEKSSENCSENNLELKKKCVDLEDKIINLEKEIENLRTVKNTLEVNLSSLIKTAKTEIARKDRMITELRTELDNTVFRRSNYRIPKINHGNNVSNNISNTHTNEQFNNLTKENVTRKIDSNNVGNANSRLFTADKSNDKNYDNKNNNNNNNNGDDDDNDDGGGDDDDDSVGDIYEPNKFTSTVYGERLRKKLLEQEAEEKLQKEQSKCVTSTTTAISQIENTIEINSTQTNRNNKENQCHEVVMNENNDESSAKRSLKRLNDEVVNEHSEKRKKLNNRKTENVDKRDDDDSNNINTFESHESYKRKISYRLHPIETPSKIQIRKQDERASVQKNNDDYRDKYHDKYRKRYNNNRSRSRDRSYYSDRRRDFSSTNKEFNRRNDTDRFGYYCSSNDRDLHNKYEMRRERVSSRLNENSNYGSRRFNMERNYSENRKRDSSTVDRKYDRKNNKQSSQKQKRSCELQNNDNYKSNSREIDKKCWDRCKSSTEISNDDNKDSSQVRKYESEIMIKVDGNEVNTSEQATSLDWLRKDEIIGTPKSPQKNSESNTILDIKSNDENSSVNPLDNPSLDTLSIDDTPDSGLAGRSYSKLIFTSPQEEKIENIEAFIRNYNCDEMSTNILSMMKNEYSDRIHHSPCNTRKNITEILTQEINKDSENTYPKKPDKDRENIAENSINQKTESQSGRILSEETFKNITEIEETVNDLLIEPKDLEVGVISTNNISTSYTDVLSKYVHRKKKSSTNDPVLSEDHLDLLSDKVDTKDSTEPVQKINDNLLLPDKQLINEKYDYTSNNIENISIEPLNKFSMQTLKDIQNDNEINKMKCNTVKNVDMTVDISECITQSHNTGCQNGNLNSELNMNINNMNNSMKVKDISPNKPLAFQPSNCCDKFNNTIICAPVIIQEELLITVPQTKIRDEIINGKETKNQRDELKTINDSSILSKDLCKQQSENSLLKHSNKQFLLTSKQNKKIIVARRQKRPVQLTNSCNSLTVVLSAYNINNNRICKSKMRTPVKLSDT